jgi:MoaD family protein
MPEVTLRLYATLREIAGEGKIIMNVPEGSSVKELIRSLFNQYKEKFIERYGLLFKKNNMEERFLVFVNNNPISSLNGFETKLKDKDKVEILEPISGG